MGRFERIFESKNEFLATWMILCRENRGVMKNRKMNCEGPHWCLVSQNLNYFNNGATWLMQRSRM